ncbi:MAG: serine/threonine protein kinase [Planctomycetes bacterium]|nr:serine/threonine protein kinase [Planctomycetota bacterium]
MASRSVFRESAIVSGLLTLDQLERAEDELREGAEEPRDPNDESLANRLIERGLLTPYQAAQLREGRTKLNLGPYLVTDYIDKGGMGQVYKAVHKVMGRLVAVKVLPLHKSTPDAIDNFMREIRTQAQLDHPHLVRAFDAGHDGGVHYLVCEYVPGTDLRRLVRSQGPLTMRQASSVIMQASIGLEYAHARGLIHRDIKPGNILVTPQGIAKLSDLGLAGFIHEAEGDPRTGRIVGTPDYLAPELIGDPTRVGRISDIYSLGCTLYYAVTGKVPFPGGTTSDKLRRHRIETPWHPRRFNAEISEEFVEIIADLMEKDPAARVATAEEVAARLEPWATDVSSFPSTHLTKSPWMPPPFPTGQDDGQETDAGAYDEDPDSSRPESASHASQITDPTAAQETSAGPKIPRSASRRRQSAPPLPLSETARGVQSLGRSVCVAIALAIAVPVSMLFGAALTYVLLTMLRRG